MADKRCPKCGSNLSPTARVCNVCGNFLDMGGDDTPDWLRELGGSLTSETPAEPVENEPAAQSDTPDWLARIRARKEEEQSGQASDEGDAPDWLRELKGDTSPASGPAEAEAPDWLASLAPRKVDVEPVESTPAAPPPFDFDQPAPADGVDDNDWLRSLQSQSFSGESAKTAEPEAVDDNSDWMAALSAINPEPEISSNAAPQEAAGDTLDWLAALGSTSTEAEIAPEAAPQQAVGETPDWLAALGGTTPEAEITPEAAPQEAAGETPDWLAALGGTVTEPETPAEVAPLEAAGETPDWLAALGGTLAEPETPAEAAPQEAAGETPDWLAALGGTLAEPETPAQAAPQEAAGETPDWLAALGGTLAEPETPAEVAPQEAAGETPDWLSALGGTTPEAEITPEAAPQEAAGETPDWLSAFGSTTPGAEIAPDTTPQEAAASETPDWLSALGGTTPEAEIAPETTPQEAAGETPDWLSALGGTTPEAEITPEAAPQEAAGETPDWLSALNAMQEEPEVSPETAPQEPAAETPDWLSAFQPEPAATMPETPAETPTGVPGWLDAFAEAQPAAAETPEESGIPDWMNALNEPADAGAARVESTDWLGSFGEAAGDEAKAVEPSVDALQPETPATPSASPFALDIPDWLIDGGQAVLPETIGAGAQLAFTELPSDVAQPSTAPFTGMEGEEAESELEPSQMPGWLAAMRPVEAVAPVEVASDSGQYVENAGPLAGLAGILQGENLVQQYNRPPVYSARLRLTERQKQNVSLFETMIAEAAQPKTVKEESGVHPRRILRLVVGLLLIGVILLSLFTPVQIFLPKAQTFETTGFINQMNLLPADGTGRVLVAFDYQPSFAGEMKYLARPVIEDLMKKNVQLVTLSTLPGGSALADDLLWDVQRYQPGYVLESQTVSLGYLAGGATGLQQLGSNLQKAMPVTSRGGAAWSLPQLAGVQSLGDFSAVILISDDPTLIKAWVEQTRTAIGSKPLLVIASAQAAPMLLPYSQSAQINGMLGGLNGGALYEQATQRPLGQASIAWAAYQNGILLLVVLMIAGALVQGVSRLTTRAKSNKKA